MLFTLACGPRVEIGHGSGAAQGGTAGSLQDGGADTGATAGNSVGGSKTGGSLPTGGSDAAGSSTGGRPVGATGPIPADTGPQAAVGKVDLLLAVDNSISMADKQALFAEAMPQLVERLINPRCVSTTGKVVAEPTSPDAACPEGSSRELDPIRDLHVGVITSSLGSHGAPGAKDVCVTADKDDHAHLLPTVRDGVPSYNDTGYLNWDPDAKASPPGEKDPLAFAASVSAMIQKVGEHGCGYEAQLESIYRFLVDPDPPASIQLQPEGNTTQKVSIDKVLLDQRDAFLRPDSSVVVLMLTDENDCSIQDEGYGWLIARSQSMYRSTSQCATNPNDPCCQSCVETEANPGCPALNADPECQKGNTLPLGSDDLNLRCWAQKKRFGFSLLYPTERYVGGFGDADVEDRTGKLVPNPLFHSQGINRDRSLFTLAVIGGVPWQDLATPASLKGATLEYMTSEQLTSTKRWSVILGDPETYTPPNDPFMIEQPDERSGQNPITGDAIVGSGSTNPSANAINGHEQLNVANNDLQYACTFPLAEPKLCDAAADMAGNGCDCFAEDAALKRSICQPPSGGTTSITQFGAKAYPALRELDVARQLGRRSVLGSICARNTQDQARADYGYGPVFNAIGRRVADTLLKP